MLIREKAENFEDVYAILNKSFPEDERRSHDSQKALMQDDRYIILSERRGGNLIGFLAVWNFPEFVYLEHFAVDENFRNGGMGKEMLNEMITLFDKPVMLEVEPPETEITKRRIGFYKRNGFSLNEYDYVQLPYGEDRNPVPLKLMTYPRAVSENEFEKIRDTVYREIFGVENWSGEIDVASK